MIFQASVEKRFMQQISVPLFCRLNLWFDNCSEEQLS